MIEKFLAKYITEVIPSIIATVIGAYIVTHYINAKPDDKPVAVASAPAVPAKAAATPKSEIAKTEPAKAESIKSEPARAESVKAETAKSELVKAEPETAKSETAAEIEKSGDKSAQAARVLRHHQMVMKERAAKATATEKAAVAVPPPEVRDANDIARAAIERLRSAEPRASETKAPERKVVNTVGYAPAPAPVQAYTPSPVQAPPAAAYVPPPMREAAIPPAMNPPAMTPLPSENVTPLPMPPPTPVARIEYPSRPTPPADIPPLDIRARDNGKQDASVADDVVSAAKNAFQSVLPH
jgi:hypothetical protein